MFGVCRAMHTKTAVAIIGTGTVCTRDNVYYSSDLVIGLAKMRERLSRKELPEAIDPSMLTIGRSYRVKTSDVD